MHITSSADYYRISISDCLHLGKPYPLYVWAHFVFIVVESTTRNWYVNFVKYTLKYNVNFVAALVQATLVFCYQYNTLLNDSLFNWNHTISYFINVFGMNMIENSELLSSLCKLSQLVQKYI